MKTNEDMGVWPANQTPRFSPSASALEKARQNVATLSQAMWDCADELNGARQSRKQILKGIRLLEDRLSKVDWQIDSLQKEESRLAEQLAEANHNLCEIMTELRMENGG
jgi:chromosome segregation ATPase